MVELKTVSITDEAYEYVRKLAFELRQPIGVTISKTILANVKEVD